jgi:hypothetical protein
MKGKARLLNSPIGSFCDVDAPAYATGDKFNKYLIFIIKLQDKPLGI